MGYRLSDDELQRLMNAIGGNHDSVSRSTIMASQIDWRHLQVRDINALHAQDRVQESLITILFFVYHAPRSMFLLFVRCRLVHRDCEVLYQRLRRLSGFEYDLMVPESQGCCGSFSREAGQNQVFRFLGATSSEEIWP